MLVSRLVALCHTPYLPSPAKTSIHARFRGRLLFATTTLLENEQHMLVFERGCSLPPPPSSLDTSAYARFEAGCSLPLPLPPFSCKNGHTRLFSRVVALCHHLHHPPPSKRAHMLISRLVALCHSSYFSSIILLIIYFCILFAKLGP